MVDSDSDLDAGAAEDGGTTVDVDGGVVVPGTCGWPSGLWVTTGEFC